MSMFTKHFDRYACEGDGIRCTHDGIEFTARLVADTDTNAHDYDQPGWVYDTTSLKYGESNRRILAAWDADEWRYVGVVIDAEVGGWERLHLASLWGLECNFPLSIATDNPNEHLREAANQLLPEALAAAKEHMPKAALERGRVSSGWDVKDGAYADAPDGSGYASIEVNDTTRVEAALEWIDYYGRELDRLELPPNGDDWNELRQGLESILRDGVVPSLILRTTGR